MPEHGRKVGKRKKQGKRKRAAIIALIIIAVVAASFLGYGLTYRAAVDFTFGGKNELRQWYHLTAMSKLQPATIDITHVRIGNTGSTGINVIVTMHALNAVTSLGYYGPYTDSSNVQIYLPPGGGYQVVTFYLTLPMQVTTFTLRVTVGQVWDFSSLPNLATSSLTSIQPTAPTTVVYTQTSTNPIIYQLSQQY